MSENINSLTPFSSGGHVWSWGEKIRARKVLHAPGVKGAAEILIHAGERPLVIAGRDGAALLKATGETKAAADAAMGALESAIEALCDSGSEYPWEDDQGHTGTALVLHGYQRMGRRQYFAAGLVVWQRYRVTGAELNGDPS